MDLARVREFLVWAPLPGMEAWPGRGGHSGNGRRLALHVASRERRDPPGLDNRRSAPRPVTCSAPRQCLAPRPYVTIRYCQLDPTGTVTGCPTTRFAIDAIGSRRSLPA